VALMDGRDYVQPADLRKIFLPVTLHRILLIGGSSEGRARERKHEVLLEVLESVRSPI
jgi:hypothetical protein